jgi:hypothetical protein
MIGDYDGGFVPFPRIIGFAKGALGFLRNGKWIFFDRKKEFLLTLRFGWWEKVGRSGEKWFFSPAFHREHHRIPSHQLCRDL